MPHILFIDDDENILHAFRRRLHSTRPDWELTFAHSGQDALDLANQNSFDVFVSDIQMPGMDGVTLLEQLEVMQPQSMRIILTGHADNAAYLRTIGPAHQFLSKPCDNKTLINSIEVALGLREALANPKLRDLVGDSNSLVSPPDTYLDLEKAFENPNFSIQTISKIVESDIALTAEVLKLTNSPYFAIAQPVTSVSHAVAMIGMETLKALALFVGMTRGFKGTPQQTANLKLLCKRSQQIGVTAALIAEFEHLPRETCQAVPSLGMLGHVGTLSLHTNWPAEMDAIWQRVKKEDIDISQAEIETFGASHAQVGAYLLGLWGFPAPIIQAVAYQHCPQDLPQEGMSPVTAIYLAQHLVQEIHQTNAGLPVLRQIDLDYLTQIDRISHLEEWEKIAWNVAEQFAGQPNT
ncbi:HDOD domain-containing protein [Thalassospira sp. MA62]|nr:HDOD domain-containing protein [Thalassospira sp. MA62]